MAIGRGLVIVTGGLVLALVAGVLTQVSLAIGDRLRAGEVGITRPTPLISASPAPTIPAATSTPTPVAVATPISSPVATPVPTPVAKTATAKSYVHLRAGASTSTAILTDLYGGEQVELLSYSDAQWQQVRYKGITGYIFKLYLNY